MNVVSMINWTEIGGFGALIVLLLSLYGYIDARLKKVEECGMRKDLCEQRYAEMKTRLDKGEERFAAIDKKLDSQTVVLTEVATTVKLIAQKSGINV